MENQHRKISGYRELSEAEVALMNVAKRKATEVGELVDAMEGTEGLDLRWLSIAKTDLQKGFMALVRSIAQPTTF